MEDLFQHKDIRIDFELSPKRIFASPFLMEVLISNLLSNVLSYTVQGAKVAISLDEAQLAFTNEGEPLGFPESKLFTRFGKGSPSYKGNGLGLSIVKQICLSHQWEISYDYVDNTHIFRIRFDMSTLG